MVNKLPHNLGSRVNSSEKVSPASTAPNSQRTLSHVMSKNLRLVNEDFNVGQARKLMIEHHIRHILVVHQGTGALQGVLSDRDVRAIVSPFVGTPEATERDNATLNVRVGLIMKKPPFVAKGDEPLRRAVEIVLQKKVGCVPVVDSQGKPVGIVTTDDLLREMLNVLG
jgi:acetoin utilization protein AcuB